MNIVRSMIQLLQRSASQRSIAQELNISRNTIARYKEAFAGSSLSYGELLDLDDHTLSEIVYPGVSKPNPEPPSNELRIADFEARRTHFLKELNRTGVNKKILWQEYRSEFPGDFGYTQFCERLSRFQKTADVSMRIEYKPADTMMIDFAGDKLYYPDPGNKELITCPVLVCVLPFSGYSYVEALPNASLVQLVKALNNCLRFFGGSPLNLITDNMRQMVTRSCRYEPLFTDLVLAWAQHNNIHLKAARVRSPPR